jgi:hypothetical protein
LFTRRMIFLSYIQSESGLITKITSFSNWVVFHKSIFSCKQTFNHYVSKNCWAGAGTTSA